MSRGQSLGKPELGLAWSWPAVWPLVNDNLKVSLSQSAKRAGHLISERNALGILLLLKKSLPTSNLSTCQTVCEGDVFSMVHLVRKLSRILQKPHLLPAHGDQRSYASDLPGVTLQGHENRRAETGQGRKPEAPAHDPPVKFKTS